MYSLPDWVFYPLATLAAASMIAGALNSSRDPARMPEEILADGIMFEGDSLNAMTLGNGLSAQMLTEGGTTFARIEAVRGPFDGQQSAGAFFALSPVELTALQGHSVRIQFTVRSADENGAAGLRTNFFVPGVGQSDWHRDEISGGFEIVTLDQTAPSCRWDIGYIGLWPDWDFERNTIDLERVELSALERNPDC